MVQKRMKNITGWLLCILCVIAIFPQTAFAANTIDDNKNVTLTISYKHNGSAISGANFHVYKVADVTELITFIPTSDFSAYSISFESLNSDDWKALASTLAAYVARDKLQSIDHGTIDNTGILKFPYQQDSMTPGLYLIIGDQITIGNDTYSAQPFLICLPNRISDGQWTYENTAVPKYDISHDILEDIVTRKVLKVWNDEDNEANRPEEITVQLLRNGEIYATVILNKQNDWKYLWENLDDNATWQIVEKDVPDGYTVTVDRQGITFVITNTFKKDKPKPPEPPDEPDPPIDIPAPPPPLDPSLPQTGIIWWPISLFTILGMFLLLVGLIIRLNNKGQERHE